MKHINLFLSLGVLCGLLSGCVIAMGNRDLGKPRATQATLGQQLIDLKKARDADAMTEAEYEKEKQRLLQENNKK
jgi:hypothetical protein